jgi:hypothetical protein
MKGAESYIHHIKKIVNGLRACHIMCLVADARMNCLTSAAHVDRNRWKLM